MYTNPNRGLTGRMINMTPRFVGTIPPEEEGKLFNWSETRGAFVRNNNNPLTLEFYNEYLTSLKPIEEQ